MSELVSIQHKIDAIRSKLSSVVIDEGERRELEKLIDELNKECECVTTNECVSENHFTNFYYFPGTVLILDDTESVVFQNKPFLDKLWVKGRCLADILSYIETPELLKAIDHVKSKGLAVCITITERLNYKPVDVFINLFQHNKNSYLLFFFEYKPLSVAENLNVEVNKSKSTQEAIIRKYREITNGISDIFFILDAELNFTFVAPSIERILQYGYNEIIGQEFDILVPEWSGNTLRKNIETVLAVRLEIREPLRFTIQLSSKFGQLIWYEVQINAIYDKNHIAIQGYNGICRDITERLKYEEALRLAKIKAEESDRLKSAFLANMSHEIRTPLNGIMGFSQMLSDRKVIAEKREKYSKYVISSSKQLLTIINDIIDISKIEAGQINIFDSKVSIADLLEEIIETLDIEKGMMERKNVQLLLSLPDLPKFELYVDEVRLRQVLTNLLSNALKFTKEGFVELGFNIISSQFIRFYVKDTGVGITPMFQKSIFERFRQGEIDRKVQTRGTGLGLAISKGFVNLMGGEIGVTSEVGVGSEFYFTLPMKVEPEGE